MAESKRRWWIGSLTGAAVLAAAVYGLGPLWLRTADHEPPRNFIAVSERLASAGQPSAAQLRALRTQGYALVINLAPPGAYGSVPEEGALLESAGIRYRNIAVDFDRPGAQDFERFREALAAGAPDRVLVHCQLNYRASSFVFLYRAIHERVAPFEAAEPMLQVWRPNETWRQFLNDRLREHGIDFQV
jgi:protein tyrosine phosphatase (PTP) superfamily phosphohydrolase (DUF442 family)